MDYKSNSKELAERKKPEKARLRDSTAKVSLLPALEGYFSMRFRLAAQIRFPASAITSSGPPKGNLT
jgi:hypothetical protein